MVLISKKIVKHYNYLLIKSLTLIVGFLFFFNFINKIANVYDFEFYLLNTSFIYKGIITLLFGLSFLINNKNKISIYLYGLISIFILNIIIAVIYNEKLKVDLMSFKYLFKTLFMFLVLSFLYNNKKKINEFIGPTIQFLLKFGKINVAIMLVGFMFEINLFKSYPNSLRFGYNGVMPISGMGTYFYCFLLSISSYSLLKNKKNTLDFIIFFVGAILIGSKAIYLFLVLLTIILLSQLIKNKVISIAVIFLLSFMLLILREKLLNFYFNLSGNIIDVNSDFITKITSTRNILFKNAVDYISNSWTWNNYLFGAYNFIKIRVEFELIDLFLFFGLSGIITFFLFLKNIFFDSSDKIYSLLILSNLVVSFFSGNLFFSITNSFLFTLIFIYMKNINYLKKS